MKYIHLVLLLLVAEFATAQNVNIPDPNVKAALIAQGIDTNLDGEIQVSEAEVDMPFSLTFNGSAISDLTGLTAFKNIHTLYVSETSITSLDVSGLSKLYLFLCSRWKFQHD